jgi:RNA polymerase sigma factor (sigma-70 family)
MLISDYKNYKLLLNINKDKPTIINEINLLIEELHEQILEKYKGLIYSVALKYYTRDLEDLISVGQMELITSIESYDESKSKFSTYVYQKLRNAMRDELPSHNIINVSTYARERKLFMVKYYNIEKIDIAYYDNHFTINQSKIRNALESILGGHYSSIMLKYNEGFSFKEIAKELGLDERKVENSYWTCMAKLKKNKKRLEGLL